MTKQNNAKLDQNELPFEQNGDEVSIQVTVECYGRIFSISSIGQRNGIAPPPPSPRKQF